MPQNISHFQRKQNLVSHKYIPGWLVVLVSEAKSICRKRRPYREQ